MQEAKKLSMEREKKMYIRGKDKTITAKKKRIILLILTPFKVSNHLDNVHASPKILALPLISRRENLVKEKNISEEGGARGARGEEAQ